jgi:DNA-binding NarL/FixJ family response regulator
MNPCTLPARVPAPMTPTTLALSRFSDLLALGLQELLARDPSIAILAADIEHSRMPVVLSAHRPDVAILDGGALQKLAEIRALRARCPATRLVVLVSDLAAAESAQMLAFGASACLRTDAQSRDLLSAVHLAARGLQLTSRDSSATGDGPSVGSYLLTTREAEVLPLLQRGRSNAQIAAALQIGVETVRTHARNIYRKLGVSSRQQLAAPAASVPSAEPEPASPAPSRHRVAAAPALRARRGHGLRQGGRRA